MKITEKEARRLGIPIPEKKKRSKKKTHPWGGKYVHGNGEGKTSDDELFNRMCEAHGLPLPESEHYFCPGRKFRADYCFDGWLLVEIDGGLYGQGDPCPTCGRKSVGAHSSITQMKRDRERDILAIVNGYILIRLLPEQIADGSGFAIIREVLGSRDEQP